MMYSTVIKNLEALKGLFSIFAPFLGQVILSQQLTREKKAHSNGHPAFVPYYFLFSAKIFYNTIFMCKYGLSEMSSQVSFENACVTLER